MEFVKSSKNILENKAVDAAMIKKKWECWRKCENMFKSIGYNREAKALRELYFRMKLHAKSSIRKYKSARTKTGGGSNEAATPSDLDWALMSIAPEDFKKDDSNFDSDAIVCINAIEKILMHFPINCILLLGNEII